MFQGGTTMVSLLIIFTVSTYRSSLIYPCQVHHNLIKYTLKRSRYGCGASRADCAAICRICRTNSLRIACLFSSFARFHLQVSTFSLIGWPCIGSLDDVHVQLVRYSAYDSTLADVRWMPVGCAVGRKDD